jgi:hypothetical protein
MAYDPALQSTQGEVAPLPVLYLPAVHAVHPRVGIMKPA